MIGLTCLVVALTAGAMAEGPSGKAGGATSYSVYHRKFEPTDGGPRSVSYSTKLGSKLSSSRGDHYSKDSPTSSVKGSGPSKDTQSYSDGPNYSKSGSSYSDSPNYYKSGSSYSNDGPPPKENYSNDGPNYSKSGSSYSGPPNHSGESYESSGGFSPSNSYSDGASYDAAPHSNNPPPVYDTPNAAPDAAYNNGPSYVPPPPVNVPQYDGPPVSAPFVNGGSSYPVNLPAPQYSPYSSGHSNFPVSNFPVNNFQNIPNVGGNFQSNIPNVGGNFQSNIPNVGNYHSAPNVGSFNIPNIGNLNIPNIGNLNIPNVGNLNIPKPSFSSPFVNPVSSLPGQFSYPIDRSGSQFSSPLKVYHQSVPLQQPLLLASAKVPIIFRPSFHSQSG
ncbi:hypothetical protein GE061_014805 [Apolygus lucorum]|uniref:Uncharacterized protein n=1 Tax=Apolygus lucorum TaxID=248454 RepID=A0A8S9XJ76_APOLU|nr:hypothetical protein GE061_014805 [Apolygus lucorum]